MPKIRKEPSFHETLPQRPGECKYHVVGVSKRESKMALQDVKRGFKRLVQAEKPCGKGGAPRRGLRGCQYLFRCFAWRRGKLMSQIVSLERKPLVQKAKGMEQGKSKHHHCGLRPRQVGFQWASFTDAQGRLRVDHAGYGSYYQGRAMSGPAASFQSASRYSTYLAGSNVWKTSGAASKVMQ